MFALTHDPHDRVAHHRPDEAWAHDAWSHAQVLPVSGGRLRVRNGSLGWLAPEHAPEGIRVLLGERSGAVRFAVVTDKPESDWVTLRECGEQLSEEDSMFALHAIGIAEWLARTQFCPVCGSRLKVGHLGHEARCERCGRAQFPRTDPAVIMTVLNGDRCLLGRQKNWPETLFSTLAGFVEPGESLEHAVRREVREEVGVLVGEVTYVASQPWPLPASLMVGFQAHATSDEITVDETEIVEARWFTRSDVRDGLKSGALILPSRLSISRALIERWLSAPTSP